jgi:D-xylose transport system substrate-binding protein
MPSARSGMRAKAAVVAVAALSIGVAACGGSDNNKSSSGGSSSGGSGGKVAFLMPETKTTRYEAQDRPNFTNDVKQMCPNCQVIYANAQQDPAKQQQQAEAAITQGAKVIVISAVDVQSAASSIVPKAKQQNVKVIAYGRLIPNADIDYYVSIDPFKVGQQQAQSLLADAKKQGKAQPRVVMINGSPTDSNAAPYKNGALSVFKKAGAKVVKTFDTADWSPDKAQQEMEQTITSLGNNGFDAVYVANDGMASGVIAALKGAKLDPAKFSVTGQDAELAGVQRILAGEQLMTVYQPLKLIAKSAAEMAVPIAQGKTPPASVTPQKVNNGKKQVPSALLDTIAITKGNIQSTVVKDGFLKPNAICAGKYAKECQANGVQ